MVTGVDNWHSVPSNRRPLSYDAEKSPCSAALPAAPSSGAAGFVGAAMARAGSRITLENATMDDWIPGAAETTTGPQNETLGLPLVSEGISSWWLNQTTSQSVAQGVSAATAPATAPAASGTAEQGFDTWLMP
ncbi:hypothetical protein Esi_0078_0068 [Ectocarpus siliculosus]|uniref:Uncharacterized protein n=1 Tax=Ectocarpus siliculosus TaxID=2880 RepID=D8LT54_ECTSI|nr:hypothetical protein Esi_0078_0068 [Ectocarpus siliculosus]|eukprot:CBN75328.1 hypothetical protein Esi_0078_0068 [Ectocarpus siliculosus]